MAISGHLFFLALILPLVSCISPIKTYCGSNFTGAVKVLQRNLDYVLPDLVKRTPIDGYAISSYGIRDETIYGLTRCRADVSADACLACIAEAARNLSTACIGKHDARIWYDNCFLRYGTDEFIGSVDTDTSSLILMNVLNATDPEKFDKAVAELMHTLQTSATAQGNKRFARGSSVFEPNVTIYGVVQCTRDLSAAACNQCLASAVELYPTYCRFRQGCQVLYSSCVLRYEIYDFLYNEKY